jgi:hypothetical protein
MTRVPADVRTAITPVILTWNEAENIARSLDCLGWARRVVIVDSGSTDDTGVIAGRYANVDWIVRPFDTHARQWSYAIHQTSIETPYVLALDADYRVPRAFVEECASAFLAGSYDGAVAGFEYHVLGRALMGSVYPAKPVLFRPAALRIEQPGHTQEMHVDGSVYRFAARLIHDDRKPVSRFVQSQIAYSRLEAQRLAGGGRRWQDRVRRSGLMPLVAGVAAYVRAGGPFLGRAALRYAWERTLFECMLAMRLLEGAPERTPVAAAPDATGNAHDGSPMRTVKPALAAAGSVHSSLPCAEKKP